MKKSRGHRGTHGAATVKALRRVSARRNSAESRRMFVEGSALAANDGGESATGKNSGRVRSGESGEEEGKEPLPP